MMYKPFTPARFEQLVKEFQEQEALIMSHKGDEYAANEDRLLNFHQVAEFMGRTPAEVALSYLLKHIQSIALAVKAGKYTWAWETEGGEGLKQRIADARNYLLFLAACLEEANDSVMFDDLDLITENKQYKFTIPGTLPGLNEYINAERGNRYQAAKLKSKLRI